MQNLFPSILEVVCCLKILIDSKFDALLTFDKNLQHQQNFEKYTIAVFVLSAKINTYSELTNLTPKIKEYLNNYPLPIGEIIILRSIIKVEK